MTRLLAVYRNRTVNILVLSEGVKIPIFIFANFADELLPIVINVGRRIFVAAMWWSDLISAANHVLCQGLPAISWSSRQFVVRFQGGLVVVLAAVSGACEHV